MHHCLGREDTLLRFYMAEIPWCIFRRSYSWDNPFGLRREETRPDHEQLGVGKPIRSSKEPGAGG